MRVAVPEVQLGLLERVEIGRVGVGDRRSHGRWRRDVNSDKKVVESKLRRQRRSVLAQDAANMCAVILRCDVRRALVETRMKMLDDSEACGK